MTESLLRRRSLLGAGGAIAGSLALAGFAASPAMAASAAPSTPKAALAALLDGNKRFVNGTAKHPHQSGKRLKTVAAGQDPFAIVLGCADSRVSAELLFDQGIGDLFVNRVAGNVVDDLLLGSMEYAVAEFGPPLLIVLGHERCGAIKATVGVVNGGEEPPGHIGAVVAALRPIVAPYAGQANAVEKGVQVNVLAQAAAVVQQSAVIRERVEKGAMAVVGARYDLDTGKVKVLG
ncbi:carbonic anhydrase, partial [Actinoplanes palleronii]|uniref:carbonic anhydrase n=1 Tax=Actinoplanes palleronii TaxID=113570 RepID=UPI00194326B3